MMILRPLRTILASAMMLGISAAAHADDIQDASALLGNGQPNQALEKINDYLKNKPQDARARFMRGLILYKQGRIDDAIQVYAALIEEYPELPEPYNNLAVLYSEQGEYDKARLTLEMAIRDHPEYAIAHGNLGDIYVKLASLSYGRSLQPNPKNIVTRKKLALAEELLVLNKSSRLPLE
jgi:tetratricopeptide (TPR) repeat protein